MKLAIPLLLLAYAASVMGYYQEGVGERRDALPMPFGFDLWAFEDPHRAG